MLYKRKDYLIPNFKLDNKEYKNIGKYGILKLEYLKNNKKAVYPQLLVENKLNEYLYDVDVFLKDYEERLINKIASNENITEELKSKDQLEWFRQMNNIKCRVQEIIMKEYIYV
ncbi:MAG: TnpV protein [Bacilli bacterium]